MDGGERIRAMRFTGTWRRYQELALEAFDRDVAAETRRTHIVAPPGSGKTLLGVEIVRRIGRPALVLAPNTAVQSQWLRTVADFANGDGVATDDPSGPIACLTYQSMCRLDDPAALLGDLAARRWAQDRAATVAQTPDEVLADAATWTGEAARRRDDEQARITASIKREIARAEHGDLHLGQLLSPAVRERLDALKAGGVGTIVLDECHHLASLWGYVVRAIVEEVPRVHVVGLTATPPGELTREEETLYRHFLGPVDFRVPTPAVVRDGHLAPYQELAWLTEPLDSERAWLTERDMRFNELVTALHADPEGPWSFPQWVIARLREERPKADDDDRSGWAALIDDEPDFAEAGARFLASAGLRLPKDIPRGEAYRRPPTLDDWLVLLERYAIGCLGTQSDPAAGARYDAIAAALRELGFTLTRQGVRRGSSQVDRLLTESSAKALALADVIACELDARQRDLRGVVIVDTELARRTPDPLLVSVLRAGTGTAGDVALALATDERTAFVRPLVVSGRGLRCVPSDAEVLIPALSSPDRQLHAEPVDDEGLVRLASTGPDWTPATWVKAATDLLTAGTVRVLIGTRAMLAEGWDAPCVNVMVDLTSATTSTSVTQMRGRSLRLDPQSPGKIASNWDIVCVAPGLSRGEADYERFVRKHLHVFAPCEDGVIESGPSHVHPALGPFAPPPAEQFAVINAQASRRAADHAAARERWKIGTPYIGAEYDTVVVRNLLGHPPPKPRNLNRPPNYQLAFAGPGALALGSWSAAILTGFFTNPISWASLVGVPIAAVWAWLRVRRAGSALQEELPVDYAAAAIRDAYVALGEISKAAGKTLTVSPRADGYVRVWLSKGTPQQGALMTKALDELLDPEGEPRYLVSRRVHLPDTAPRLVAWMLRRDDSARRWLPVPADLGRRKDRAKAFAHAARRWLGRGELVAINTPEGARAFAEYRASLRAWEATHRRVWM